MGSCFSCLANKTPCCVRITLCILCFLVCIGPLLLLIGLALYFVPYYAVRFNPSVYEYNVLSASFASSSAAKISAISVEASSAVPILGTFGTYNDLVKGTRLPPIQGVQFGVANTPSISHFGIAGALLGGITGYYKFRIKGGGLASSQVVAVDAPGSANVTFQIVCTWANVCTAVNIDFCPVGFSTYSGSNSCNRDTTCGTCAGKLFLLQICALVTSDVNLWISSPSRQGCYSPFIGAGDFASPTPVSEVPVQLMHHNDPYVVLQLVSNGTNDLKINFTLLALFQEIGAALAILSGFIIVITILCLCATLFSQQGRQNLNRTWERFLGIVGPEEEERPVMKNPPPMVEGGYPMGSAYLETGGQFPQQAPQQFYSPGPQGPQAQYYQGGLPMSPKN